MKSLQNYLILYFLIATILTTLNSCSSGSGEIIYPDGSKYIGHYIKNEQGEKIKDGEGTLTFSDGHKYVGIWVKNYLSNGSLHDEKGELIYQGEWKGGKYNGKGKLSPREGELSGYLLDGHFLDGKANGFGTLFKPDSTKEYEGYWKDFQYDGNGIFYLNGKKMYEGNFKNGICEGKGTIFAQDGKIEGEGEFKNYKLNGYGRRYQNGKLYYEGYLKDNLPEGKGTLYDENEKRIFEGQYKKGIPNGYGVAYNKTGEKEYEGQFVNGAYKKEVIQSATNTYRGSNTEEKSSSTLLDRIYGKSNYTEDSNQEGSKFCFNDRYDSGNKFELRLIDGGIAKLVIKNSSGQIIRTGEGSWEGRNDGPGGNAPQVILRLSTGTLRFTAIVGGYPSSINMLIDSKDNQWLKCF